MGEAHFCESDDVAGLFLISGLLQPSQHGLKLETFTPCP